MAVRKSLQQIQAKLATRIEQAGEYWFDKMPADMGNYSGVVAVPNTPNMVYVRLANGQVVKVFNNLAPNIYNWKVYIGRDKSQPSLLRVVEVRWVYNVTQTVAYVLFHHTQHEYPAPDTVWVRRDQFLPLLVLPMGGFEVQLYGDTIFTLGMSAPLVVLNQEIDLSSYVVTEGAHYILLELDMTGAVNVVVGDDHGSIEALRLPGVPLPTPTPGYFPVCAIEMYEGQTEIRRDSTERNIVDLRMFTTNADTDAGEQWHTAPATATIVDADEFGVWIVADGVLKKITWANFKLNIKTYTDTLYSVLGHDHYNDAEGDPSDTTTGSASDGTSIYSARRDHTHHTDAMNLQVLMETGPIDPPVPLVNSDGDDWLYG